MRALGRSGIILLTLLAASAALNCSGESSDPRSAAGVETGSVKLAYDVAPGIVINSLHYDIVGASNGYHAAGDVDVSQSSSLAFFVAVPQGSGYVVTLTAVSTDGTVHCAGQSTFNVATGTNVVNVPLQCRKPPKNGTVSVNGTLNLCPSLDAFSANPLEVAVGGTIALHSTAMDTDNGPSAVTYQWAGPGFSASTADATFTCTTAGHFSIAISASDGDPGCEAQAAVDVVCTAAGSPTNAILAAASPTCLSCMTGPPIDPSCDLSTLSCDVLSDLTERQKCLDTLACVLPPGAAVSCVNASDSDPTPCLCGTTATSSCLAGAPPAPGDSTCRSFIEAGFPAGSTVDFISSQLGNPVHSAGRAVRIAICAFDAGCSSCF